MTFRGTGLMAPLSTPHTLTLKGRKWTAELISHWMWCLYVLLLKSSYALILAIPGFVFSTPRLLHPLQTLDSSCSACVPRAWLQSAWICLLALTTAGSISACSLVFMRQCSGSGFSYSDGLSFVFWFIQTKNDSELSTQSHILPLMP